jgi:hypothetical protein
LSLSSTPDRMFQNLWFQRQCEWFELWFKKAKLAWYSIDLFFIPKPAGITNNDLSFNSTRRIYSENSLTDIAQGQSQVICWT